MALLKNRWVQFLGTLGLLWQLVALVWKGLRLFLEWAGNIDFAVERVDNPGWVGAVIQFFLDPPGWVTLLAVVFGALVLLWSGWWHRPAPLSGYGHIKMKDSGPELVTSSGVTSITDAGENDVIVTFDSTSVLSGRSRLDPTFVIIAGVVITAIGLATLSAGFVWRISRAAQAAPTETASTETTIPTATPPSAIPTPAGTKPEDVTFSDLLIYEFPNAAAISVEQVERGQFSTTVFAQFVTLQDPYSRSEYYAVYIPKTALTLKVSEWIAANYKSMRDQQRGKKPYERKPGEKPPVNADLPFSGQIYVYHESDLSSDQQKQLWILFQKEGAAVEFRGPKYLADQRAAIGPHLHK
jgi:hypothetical protein